MSGAVLHGGATAGNGDLLGGVERRLGLGAFGLGGHLDLTIIRLIDLEGICHNDAGEESSGNE